MCRVGSGNGNRFNNYDNPYRNDNRGCGPSNCGPDNGYGPDNRYGPNQGRPGGRFGPSNRNMPDSFDTNIPRNSPNQGPIFKTQIPGSVNSPKSTTLNDTSPSSLDNGTTNTGNSDLDSLLASIMKFLELFGFGGGGLTPNSSPTGGYDGDYKTTPVKQ